jgi:hypothetical protein
MAYDIYQKRNELNKQLEAQRSTQSDAQKKYDDYMAAIDSKDAGRIRQHYGEFLPEQHSRADLQNKAKQQFQSSKGYSDSVMGGLKEQVAKEEERIGKIKPFAELQGQQEMRAKEFRTAFPSILDSKLGTARTDMRRQIAEGVGNVRAGYNQRGLLFSGMRSGAEADVGNEAENKLADTAVQTNQELMDQGNQLDQDAVETGFTMANISKDLANTDDQYRQSVIDMLLQKDQQRQQALGGLLGTGAQLAGFGLGAAIK